MIATIPHIKGRDLSPDLLHQFNIRPEQIITITIKTEAENVAALPLETKKRKIKFLHSAKMHNKTGETDISQNHDKYLYDVNNNDESE